MKKIIVSENQLNNLIKEYLDKDKVKHLIMFNSSDNNFKSMVGNELVKNKILHNE